MYIEMLVVLSLFFIFMFWLIWDFISEKLLKWRYNPKNDKGRLAEESRGRNNQSKKSVVDVSRPPELGTGELLQTTELTPIRKDSPRPRNPFKRRRK